MDSLIQLKIMETDSGNDKKKRGRPALLTGPVDFDCPECGKKFKRKVLMKEHGVSVHDRGARFTCFVCQKGFYSRNQMLNHVKSHEEAMQPEKRYLPEDLLTSLTEDGSVSYRGVEIKIDSACLVCGRVYRNKENKRRHEDYYRDKETHSRKTVNENRQPYIKTDSFCLPCDKDFCNNGSKRNHELRKHPEIRSPILKGPKNIKCILDCKRRFGDNEQLEKHMAVGDHNGIFFFTCSKCPKKFGSTAEMKKHMLHSHEGRNVKTEIRADKTDEIKVFDLVPSVQSSIKNEEIHSDSPESRSQLKTSRINCVVNEENLENGSDDNTIIETSETNENTNIDDDQDSSEEEMDQKSDLVLDLKYRDYLKCDECGKYLPSSTSLQVHQRIHEEQKIHVCKSDKECKARFYTLEEFNTHKLSQHGEDIGARSRAKCKVCGKLSNTRSELKTHMSTHATERNFVCIECGLRFKCARTLKTHALIHTGVKKQKCDKCDFASYTRSNLRTHIRQNHEDLGDHNECASCGKKCISAYALKIHVDRHSLESRFKCGSCDTAFRDPQTRRNHEKIHDDIKDYQCSLCAKQFRQSSQLTIHMKRHNGVKTYL